MSQDMNKVQPKMYFEYYSLIYMRLEASGNVLKLTMGKKESILPITQIKSVTIKPARKWMAGTFIIDIGKAPDVFLSGGHYAAGFGNEIVLRFEYVDTEVAERIRNYIANWKPEGQITTSAADEIRKFKSLFDDGIITKEEFEIKKKELMKSI